MFDYALKNISRRLGRSLLIILGVAVMITLVIVITGIVSGQKRSMHAHASAGAGKLNVQPLLAGSSYPAEGIDLPEEDADAILGLVGEHIQASLSTKVVFFQVRPPLYPNQPPEIVLVGVEAGKEEAFTGSAANDVKPIAGVEFFAEAGDSQPVILGMQAAQFYAEALGRPLAPGDHISLLDRDLVVIGLLDRSADLVVNNAAIVPLGSAQDWLGKSGFVSSVILVQNRVGAERQITAVLQAKYPKLNLVDNSTVRKNLEAGIRLFEQMVNAISIVVIIAAAILIVTVMLITVQERRREIGVLRAMGASMSIIILSIFWEIFLLSATGCLVGGVASSLVLRYGLLENLFALGHVLAYLPVALVLTLLAGVLPAFQISRILPAESLRYE
jgi:putative ABC transport system permease protein